MGPCPPTHKIHEGMHYLVKKVSVAELRERAAESGGGTAAWVEGRWKPDFHWKRSFPSQVRSASLMVSKVCWKGRGEVEGVLNIDTYRTLYLRAPTPLAPSMYFSYESS